MTKEFDSIDDVKQYLNTVMEGFLIRLEVLEAKYWKEDEDEEPQQPADSG